MSEFNINVEGGKSVRLPTGGKYCEKDIIVTASGGGGTEEIENIIDQSGVLESTEGTIEEKVERLLALADRFKWFKTNARGVHFYNNDNITSVTLDCTNFTTMNTSFYDCSNIESIYLTNTQNISIWAQAFTCWKIKTLETIDFSGTTALASNWIANTSNLENFKLVPQTLKVSAVFNFPKLNAESIQSVFDGLAIVTTAKTLTLNANLKILQSQVDSANAKGWTVAGGTVVSEEEYYG